MLLKIGIAWASDSTTPQFQEKAGTQVVKKHKFPWFIALLGVAAVGVGVYFLTKKKTLNAELILDFILWAIVGGFIGARVFHVAFYNTLYYIDHPWDILKFWQGGASSLGGFLGAAVAWAWLIKIKKLSFKQTLPYLDIQLIIPLLRGQAFYTEDTIRHKNQLKPGRSILRPLRRNLRLLKLCLPCALLM